MSLPRPCGYLTHYAKKYSSYGNVWAVYDTYIAGRGKDLPDWPVWCFCPIAASYAIVSRGKNTNPLMLEMIDVSVLAALAAWRPTQSIYRFDPEMLSSLIDTPSGTPIPSTVLYSLPEWCLYVEMQVQFGNNTVNGFFVHLEYDVNTGRSEVRFLIDIDSELIPMILHLSDKTTVAEGLDKSIKESEQQLSRLLPANHICVRDHQSEMQDLLTKTVNLTLYICSDEPDIEGRKFFSQRKRPSLIKTKKSGSRYFPPDQPEVWSVGFKIGSKIREYAEVGGTHNSPRPHIRRAHWHTFLKGPRTREREHILKWIPPIPVNLDTGDIKPTIRHIKS